MRLAKMLKEGIARYVTKHSAVTANVPKGSAGSKHARGRQKPRNHRKMLRTQRKRQRQARLAQRGKR